MAEQPDTKRHLSDQFIKNLKRPKKRTEYYDQHLIDPDTNTLKRAGVKGLILRLTEAGNKYFYYSYWYDGQSRRFKIGDYPDISLSEAREKARELAIMVNDGHDPQAEKIARKKTRPNTFDELVERFKSQHLPTLRPSTQSSYGNRINTEILPAFKGMSVDSISRGHIIELLEEIAFERNQPTHSNRVRAILSSIFSYAVQREIAKYNPVKTIKPLGEETRRDRVYSEDEIRKLWEAFEKQREPIQSVFKILLLLGQRKGETRLMKWEDIEDGVWTIPKEHTKAKRTHYVPLSPLALEIIENLKSKTGSSPFVFESNYHSGAPVKWLNDAASRIQGETGITDFRIHDLRRTAATYMAELGTDRTILGKVLNHKGLGGDSQVTARYDRYGYMEEKRQALGRWSHRLEQILDGENDAKITKMDNRTTRV